MRVLRLASAVVGALALIGFGSLLGAAAAANSPATLNLPPNGIVQVGCNGSAIASGEPRSNPGANLGCEPFRAKPYQIYKTSGRTSASATVDGTSLPLRSAQRAHRSASVARRGSFNLHRLDPS
jgi:hypothetical protein